MTEDEPAVALIRAAWSAATDDPEIARGFQEHVGTPVRTALAERIRRGQSSAQIRSEIPADTVAELIVGVLTDRLVTYQAITTEFAKQLTEILFIGIGTTSVSNAPVR